jgi:hypothetical protein
MESKGGQLAGYMHVYVLAARTYSLARNFFDKVVGAGEYGADTTMLGSVRFGAEPWGHIRL